MPPKPAQGKDAGAKPETPREDVLLNDVVRLEDERSNLNVEVCFLREKLKGREEDQELLQKLIRDLETRLGNTKEHYSDVLGYTESQVRELEAEGQALRWKLRDLELKLQEKEQILAQLQRDNAKKNEKLVNAEAIIQERLLMEQTLEKQDQVIVQQQQELVKLHEDQKGLQEQFTEAQTAIDVLSMKASGMKDLKIFFGEPWVLTVSRHRLYGEIPADRGGYTTTCLGDKRLAVYGGNLSSEQPQPEVNILNLDDMHWQSPFGKIQEHGAVMHCAAAVMRTKLLVFGGKRGDSLNADDFQTALLNTETMRWTENVGQYSQRRPCARIGAAIVAGKSRVYLFGGRDSSDKLLNDLWWWDVNVMSWHQAEHKQIEGPYHVDPPQPRYNACIVAAEPSTSDQDEEQHPRVWVFGGNNTRRQLNDLLYFDLKTCLWNQITFTPGDLWPTPRESAVAVMLGKYIVVYGGVQQVEQGKDPRFLADVLAYDTEDPLWECLDNGSWSLGLVWLHPHTSYAAGHGKRLYTLVPDRQTKQITELRVMQLTTPDDIEIMKKLNARPQQIDMLNIANNPLLTATSIELSWIPPTRNSDHIINYKLMMSTLSGAVREVYSGAEKTVKISGLKESTEYVFCIKATYDDGSFTWSTSKSFQTKS